MPRTLDSSRETAEHCVVVGWKRRFRGHAPERVTFCGRSNLKACIPGGGQRVVFVSCEKSSTDALLKAILAAHEDRLRDQLLMMQAPRAESVPVLEGVFARVLGIGGYRWLPVEELVKVITGKDAARRFIGGAADSESETLALVRGNRQTVVVPFSMFEETGNGVKPDFGALAFTDYGHTVQLGEYEASADAILYEIDADYRRMLDKERQKSERSFGASLRRLRLQKRLKRGDFSPLAAKTIARIERNEIATPHGKSLKIIAQRLGVDADDIETY
jgi:hypothetical protein